MTSRHPLLSCFVVVTALGLFAGKTLAEPAAWDQSRVTEIASQLPAATEALYMGLFEEGQTTVMPGAFGSGDDYHEFKDKVRLMHSESMHLADELKKGEGRDQTKHAYMRIAELNRDAAEAARMQFEEDPVIARFSAVEDVLRQLQPYYGK